ncbi:MAG: AAA-like domain-containing protein [Candidatus Aminicenantes bacterium]|nr:AAA-like domain-containing protein [Candidatus Aminicenantes bacterium]
MRRFNSYGPVDKEQHYFVPRNELIDMAYTQLIGDNPRKGGHYITVWAPRQCGKTWVMQETLEKINRDHEYETAILSMELAKNEENETKVLNILIKKMNAVFDKSFPNIQQINDIPDLFTKQYFQKPVILIVDEFDALKEGFINRFAGVFRDMFMSRNNERNKNSWEKTCLLHGLALVGVRSVLGIENITGSPFNVQRSLHIPNLTFDEVKEMFARYEQESKQKVEKEAIDRLFYETNGQPGLSCWLAEILTETFNKEKNKPITLERFEEAYAAAIKVLPNNNILNIISKADKEPYKQTVLELFNTGRKIEFTYDDKNLNHLYLHGVIGQEKEGPSEYYAKFSCPFVQKRLFNYFSHDLFRQPGQLLEPMTNLDTIIDATDLHIRPLIGLYRKYLEKNKTWLFQKAPRRSDLRMYEAVFHFNFYSYLNELLRPKKGLVLPEFPTGNGKIDLLIYYSNKTYGLELKSFTDFGDFRQALAKAALYGKQLGLAEIFLVTFVESIPDETRNTYETDYCDSDAQVTVKPVFIQTGTI